MPSCPECIAKEKKSLYDQNKTEVEINEIIDKSSFIMKFDVVTKHFICKKCGLYATREQINDIHDKLNNRKITREDKQYEYLNWWQRSKKDKEKLKQ